ncbi:MAG: ferrous iron transport protein B [Candidatus Azotimanducaceae bacterium]|jgi:ferrous iron transport protein B
MSDLTFALIGNPNCGKTTLFNALTGAHQKVGNWPGVTVEKKTGRLNLGDKTVELVDLPGIYSIEQEYLGLDEQVAREFLHNESVDVVINILDATNLERNLVLTQQVLEHSKRVIVVLNMIDVAEQQGIKISSEELSRRLGVEVIPIVASRGIGLDALERTLVDSLVNDSAEAKSRPDNAAVGDAAVAEEPSANDRLVKRYHRAQGLVNGVVVMTPVTDNLTEKLDKWVLNKWLGIPLFLAMMYLMFTVAINLGAVFIDFFDILFGAVFVDGVRWLMEQASFPGWMIVLAADGLGGGIQLVATFIPVIGFLFLCLSVLESSGYMSRAAFVVDRLMSKLGLPGSAFVPLIVGFGCNVPSVMATRTLGRESDRLLTIAMAPFMSCGARLTVYALFAAAFFPENGQNVVFFLYLLGIAMAVMTGFIFRKEIFVAEVTPSFQEMPSYHLPVLKNILITTWFRLKAFVFRAGKTIILVVIGLSFLNSISVDGSFGHSDTEASVLSVVGKKITPIFAPIGLTEDNWAATVGLFTGLFAKEAVVGTLDALYANQADSKSDDAPDLAGAVSEAFGSVVSNGVDLIDGLGDPLGISIGDMTDSGAVAESQGVSESTLTNMSTLFVSPFSAFCYLVFILLYAPCVAVLGAVTKEAGWRWTALVFSWTTGLAYVTATCLYQVGTFMEHPVFSGIWLLVCSIVSFLTVQNLKHIGKRSLPTNLIPSVSVQ